MPAHRLLRFMRSTLAFACFLVIVIGACDGADSPLAPDAGEPPAPETGSAGPELLITGTAPRILFTSVGTGGYDLFKMDPQGNNVAHVTSFTGTDEMKGAWSADNKRIAMIRTRYDASKVPHTDIFLMNADGTGKRWARPAISSFSITDPSWSPDGTRLVVNVWIQRIPRLAIMKVATGEMSFVSTSLGGPQGQHPSYDPTGKKIVYAGPWGLSLEQINADGTGRKVLISDPLGTFGNPAFSPDGKRIAFDRKVNGNTDIYVKNLVDGSIKRLTTKAAYEVNPTWSPDGSRIAFVSYELQIPQIWTVSSSGGSLVRITHTTAAAADPAWTH